MKTTKLLSLRREQHQSLIERIWIKFVYTISILCPTLNKKTIVALDKQKMEKPIDVYDLLLQHAKLLLLKTVLGYDHCFSITDRTSNNQRKGATTSVVASPGNFSSMNYEGEASSDSLHCPEARSEAQTVDPSPDTPVMGQGIQFANLNQLPEVLEIADSQQTAEGSQFTDAVQLPVNLQMELSPMPRPSGIESNGVAPDPQHFELDSEDHSQDLPDSQESKASSHSRAFGIGCHSSKDRYLASLKHSALGTNETCSKLSVEAQQGRVHDMPPPFSLDTLFQLELSCLESVDEILIPEGVDVSRCSWDETTNADLDVLVKALLCTRARGSSVAW